MTDIKIRGVVNHPASSTAKHKLPQRH